MHPGSRGGSGFDRVTCNRLQVCPLPIRDELAEAQGALRTLEGMKQQDSASARQWGFEDGQQNGAPSGFSFARTGSGRLGRWVIITQTDAPSRSCVLAQQVGCGKTSRLLKTHDRGQGARDRGERRVFQHPVSFGRRIAARITD